MTIFGWDASHYDQVPDGARVVAEGFSFMTHKAGGDQDDAELAAWWRAMRPYRGKVLLGAYWVLYPGRPIARADEFVARLDSQCPGWRDGPFILQADCEIWGGNSATAPGKSDIKTFCDRLVARMPKLRPIVYAPRWAYGDSLTGLGYPLWASAYVTGSGAASALYPGDGSSRWSVYSGQTPAILQFTSSATIAGQTTCDANAYRGTLAELTTLVAPGWKADDMNLTDTTGNQAYPNRDVQDFFGDMWKLRDVLWGDGAGTKVANLSPASPLGKILTVSDRLDALEAKVAAIGTVTVSDQQLQAAFVAALEQLAGKPPAGA